MQIIIIFIGIVFSLLPFSLLSEVWGTDLESVIEDFTRDLETEISDSISGSLNNTDNTTSTQVITSGVSNDNVDNNFSSQTVTNASNNGGVSIGLTGSININSNGVCINTLIGGDSNDVVYSSGNCDDQLTGGNAADKFICGEGTDVIKDYNAKEGDIILDEQNCETILES